MAPLWAPLGTSLLALIGCSFGLINAAAPVREDTVDFVDRSTNLVAKTWYRIHGDLKASKRPPLVVVHGGPGIASEYLWPLKALTEQYGIPTVFYDQVGTGRSTHFPERKGDAKFWTEELFRKELTNLLSALGISDRPYDILGQSWGGMLGSAFATYKPKNLRRLIVSSSPASIDLWMQSCNGLLAQMPRDVQDAIRRNEKAGTFDNEEFKAATQVFYEKHVCRVVPFPTLLQQSFEWLSRDNTVYLTMNGPAEFSVIGSLRDWSIIDRLHLIDVPTLVINGRYDTAQDIVIQPFLRGIQGVKWAKMQKSSHMAHFEEPKRYLSVVGRFLQENQSPPKNS